MASLFKKLRGGRVTTFRGGRPVNPEQRRAAQHEVVRLRGRENLPFRAIGWRLGVSDRQAKILWDEYWTETFPKTRASLCRIPARSPSAPLHVTPRKENNGHLVTTIKGGRPINPGRRAALKKEVVRLRASGALTFQAIGKRVGVSDRQAGLLWKEHKRETAKIAHFSDHILRTTLIERCLALQIAAIARFDWYYAKLYHDKAKCSTDVRTDLNQMVKAGNMFLRMVDMVTILSGRFKH